MFRKRKYFSTAYNRKEEKIQANLSGMDSILAFEYCAHVGHHMEDSITGR